MAGHGHRIFMVPSPSYGYALLSGQEESGEVLPGVRLGLLHRLKQRYQRWTESALAQERALKKSRKAATVEVCYPAELSADEARRQFERRVNEEMRHHLIWLFIDFPLLVPAALAMFIPGPNVFFLFWAIRIMGHYHAWDGGKKLMTSGIVRMHPSEDLGEWQKVLRDRITERWGHVLARLEKRIGIHNLRSILFRKKGDEDERSV